MLYTVVVGRKKCLYSMPSLAFGRNAASTGWLALRPAVEVGLGVCIGLVVAEPAGPRIDSPSWSHPPVPRNKVVVKLAELHRGAPEVGLLLPLVKDVHQSRQTEGLDSLGLGDGGPVYPVHPPLT